MNDLAMSPDEFLDALPAAVRARVARLERLQERRELLEKNYLRERLALESKYEAHYAPLYAERSAVITGAAAADGGGEGGAGGAGGGEAAAAENASAGGVPCFWLTALMRCDAIREGMGEKDPDVLRHLTDLTSEKFGPGPKAAKSVEEVLAEADAKEAKKEAAAAKKAAAKKAGGKKDESSDEEDESESDEEEAEPSGFRLRFKFDSATNPYFSNAELVKTYWIEDDGVSFFWALFLFLASARSRALCPLFPCAPGEKKTHQK